MYDEIPKNEYDCNLAVYLNLPQYFHEAGEEIQAHYYFNIELIKMLKNTSNIKNCLIDHLKIVLDRIDVYGKNVNEVLIIYIYMLLDTQQLIDLILTHTPFTPLKI
jgi:hypothetical protein